MIEDARALLMTAKPGDWRQVFDHYRGLGIPKQVWFALYSVYLDSPAWAEKRTEALALAENLCAECGRDCDLQVHHMTYARVGDEEQCDLQVLCERCHRERHT